MLGICFLSFFSIGVEGWAFCDDFFFFIPFLELWMESMETLGKSVTGVYMMITHLYSLYLLYYRIWES